MVGIALFVGASVVSLPSLLIPPPPDPAHIERPAPGRPPELATAAGRNSAAVAAAAVAAAAGASAAVPVQAVPSGSVAARSGGPLASTVAVGQTVSVTLEMGETAVHLADRLVQSGVLQQRGDFLDRLEAEGLDRLLRPGKYEVPGGAGLETVMAVFRQ